jgi:hypothetical protein
MKTPEQIADGLVKVTKYAGSVWVLKIGRLLNSYQLMYDTSEVAEGLAESIRNTIVEAIKESREQG